MVWQSDDAGLLRQGPPDSPVPALSRIQPAHDFYSIQDQLGLKLEADKAPLEYFVIDSVEKPSEN